MGQLCSHNISAQFLHGKQSKLNLTQQGCINHCMRTLQEITELLNELDRRIADELEDQDLDFKQWDTKSMDKSVKMLVRTAVCMIRMPAGLPFTKTSAVELTSPRLSTTFLADGTSVSLRYQTPPE